MLTFTGRYKLLLVILKPYSSNAKLMEQTWDTEHVLTDRVHLDWGEHCVHIFISLFISLTLWVCFQISSWCYVGVQLVGEDWMKSRSASVPQLFNPSLLQGLCHIQTDALLKMKSVIFKIVSRYKITISLHRYPGKKITIHITFMQWIWLVSLYQVSSLKFYSPEISPALRQSSAAHKHPQFSFAWSYSRWKIQYTRYILYWAKKLTYTLLNIILLTTVILLTPTVNKKTPNLVHFDWRSGLVVLWAFPLKWNLYFMMFNSFESSQHVACRCFLSVPPQ